MKNLRNKIHQLIEQLSEEELEKTWEAVYTLRCDFQMNKAIKEVKDSLQPWDFLDREEALQNMELVSSRQKISYNVGWVERSETQHLDIEEALQNMELVSVRD